jgi:hypothetical protein
MQSLRRLGQELALLVLVCASPLAFAQEVPPPNWYDQLVTEIGGAAAPIALIGSAVLLVIVGIKVFKWVRRAL